MSIKDQIQLHCKCLIKDYKVAWHIRGIIRALEQARKLNFTKELDHIIDDNLTIIKKHLTNNKKIDRMSIEIEVASSIDQKEMEEFINLNY